MSASTKFATVSDGKLAYEVYGESGDPVLCLPSLGDTRREYERLIPDLISKGFRPIVTELRGNGESRGKFKSFTIQILADDIKAVVDGEKLDKISIIACSISGASAALFAIQNPARVRTLVLINPIMHTAGAFMRGTLCTLLRIPGLGPSIWASYFKSLYPKNPVEPDYLDMIRNNTHQSGTMKSIANMCWTARLDDRISAIPGSVLIFFGSRDPDFPDVKAEAASIKAKLPGADIRVIEGVGHYPQREDPSSVNPQICDWLKDLK